jgi:hypothetical protein
MMVHHKHVELSSYGVKSAFVWSFSWIYEISNKDKKHTLSAADVSINMKKGTLLSCLFSFFF